MEEDDGDDDIQVRYYGKFKIVFTYEARINSELVWNAVLRSVFGRENEIMRSSFGKIHNNIITSLRTRLAIYEVAMENFE